MLFWKHWNTILKFDFPMNTSVALSGLEALTSNNEDSRKMAAIVLF